MKEQIFKIEGFHCDACVKVATMKIKKLNDVKDVSVSSDGLAKIFAEREISLEEITASFDGLGYTVHNIA